MNLLRYTLLSDGSSDRTLLPILTWLLRANLVQLPIQSNWADLRWLPRQPKTLAERIQLAIKAYPCELLFIHRDAERQLSVLRRNEIRKALDALPATFDRPPAICVVPVRMQEAWLLFDASAIRWAAGNPNGRQLLELPRLTGVESLPDPKAILHELLRNASGLHGHRLRRMAVQPWRVTELIDDFSPLRQLSAFQQLEDDLVLLAQGQGWDSLQVL